jgi:hypothetical protein
MYKWDSAAINWRTERKILRIDAQQEWMTNVETDPKSEQRLAAQECVVCFYTTRICGQGFTGFECQMCGREETWANTCVPDLCLTCAIENGLCHDCGADINLLSRPISAGKRIQRAG